MSEEQVEAEQPQTSGDGSDPKLVVTKSASSGRFGVMTEARALRIIGRLISRALLPIRMSKDTKRRSIVRELIETERNYVDSLLICEEVYYKPLDKSISSKSPLIDTATLSQLFGNLDQIREITGGEGVRAIVEVTGSAAALQQALEYVAWEGRIALLGCTRVSDVPIDFYKYVHRRGIQLLGAHTHSRAKRESAPYHWTEQDDYRAFLKLVANGKIKASPIISEIVSPQKAHEIYRMLAEEKNPPMGIVFDWTTLA